MSVHKTAGSQYFGIVPTINAKVTHRTLPTPSEEGYQFISDASYYYNQATNQVYGALNQFFGTSDKDDPQIGEGVYKCEEGVCKMLDLNDEQASLFHEKLKGERKRITPGNALTTKVKQLDDDEKKNGNDDRLSDSHSVQPLQRPATFPQTK